MVVVLVVVLHLLPAAALAEAPLAEPPLVLEPLDKETMVAHQHMVVVLVGAALEPLVEALPATVHLPQEEMGHLLLFQEVP